MKRLPWLLCCLLLLGSCSAERNLPEVDCSECNGTGVVTYGQDHPLVINGLVEAGMSDTCWACKGEGKLLVE